MKSLTESGLRSSANSSNRELTFADLWKILIRKRAIILGTVVLALTIGILGSVFTHRRYEATAQLQIQKQAMDGLGLANMLGDPAATSDALDGTISIQTQAKILESGTLALRVVKDLNLESTDDFKPKFSPLSWVANHLAANGPLDPENTSFEDSPSRQTRALRVFSRNLQVKPISGTRLIQITYSNSEKMNKISVAQEHMATSITQYAIASIYPRLVPEVVDRGSMVVTGVSGELHQIGANLVADSMEAKGWTVQFLGSNLPHSSVIAAVEESSANVLCISTTIIANLPSVVELVEATRRELRERAPRIVLGGAAFLLTPQFGRELGSAETAIDLRHALTMLCA